MSEPYKKVIIASGMFDNEFGKPQTYLGIMKDNEPVWTDRRREITLGIGRMEPNSDGTFYIGEIRKKDDKWCWVWAIKLTDIWGFDEMMKGLQANITKTEVIK